MSNRSGQNDRSDDERLKAALGAVRLSVPGVGVEDVLRRAAAEQRSRRTMTRMAMAAAGVWLIAILAGIVVERGVTTMGQGSVMTTTVAGQGKELAIGWLVWQRRAAEGLSLEDVGAVVEPPKPKSEKTPDRQSMNGRRVYV